MIDKSTDIKWTIGRYSTSTKSSIGRVSTDISTDISIDTSVEAPHKYLVAVVIFFTESDRSF